MWLLVAFDLPTNTKQERREYTEFRKALLKLGYTRMQFSIYTRWSGSLEKCQSHQKKLEAILPPSGKVSVITFTDKQFGMMKHYYCSEKLEKPISNQGQQIEMF